MWFPLSAEFFDLSILDELLDVGKLAWISFHDVLPVDKKFFGFS